jgi:long-chain acyl-CoA synthetase
MKIDEQALAKELTFTRFDRMCETYPHHTAVVYLGEKFTYARLQDLSMRFAGALTEVGRQKRRPGHGLSVQLRSVAGGVS